MESTISLLCDALEKWQAAQNLPPECAFESLHGENISGFQKSWLSGFCHLWDEAQDNDEELFTGDGVSRRMTFPEFYATAKFVDNLASEITDNPDLEDMPGILFSGIDGEYNLYIEPNQSRAGSYFLTLGNYQTEGSLVEMARELYDWALDEEYMDDPHYFER